MAWFAIWCVVVLLAFMQVVTLHCLWRVSRRETIDHRQYVADRKVEAAAMNELRDRLECCERTTDAVHLAVLRDRAKPDTRTLLQRFFGVGEN